MFLVRLEDEKKKWFLQCFDQQESSLLRFASKIVRNQDTAQEIVQDVFVKLWEKFDEQDLGKESQWLFTVTRNACFDHLRKAKKTNIELSSESEDFIDHKESAEDTLVRNEQHEHLIKQIESLKPDEREILYLKFSEKKSYAEISQMTGKTANHIAVFVFNVMKKLRHRYKESGHDIAD